MLGLILSSVSKESTFLKVLRSVIGLKLFGGPLGLPGFGMAMRTPEYYIHQKVTQVRIRKKND